MLAKFSKYVTDWFSATLENFGSKGKPLKGEERRKRPTQSPSGSSRPVGTPGGVDRRFEAGVRSESGGLLMDGVDTVPEDSERSDSTEGDELGLPLLPERIADSGLESDEIALGNLRVRQQEILAKIGERIDTGKFELPHLPSTSMVVMDLAANPSSEIPEIVQSLSTDPVLSTRLLRMANSALYATQEPVETLHEAVMRVGMRELRSLILALSMRQVIFRTKHLNSYAEETWRQAYSVAVISRSLAPLCGMPPDKMFLMGLLHDVGKIALLSMLQREIKDVKDVTPALVGRTYLEYHERTGAIMAEGWKLSDEFISVAGCHHDYESNEEFGRSAALVSLAHRLDMNLSMGNASIYWSHEAYAELSFLELTEDQKVEIIATAHAAFLSNLEGDENQTTAA